MKTPRNPRTARLAPAAPAILPRAARLEEKGTTLDEWMAVLFRPDRPDAGVVDWYAERAERCIEQIWALARRIVAAGGEVVLEIGLLNRQARERFHARVRAGELELAVYVLDLWQPVEPNEWNGAELRFMRTDRD